MRRFAIDVALEIDVEDVLERGVWLGSRFDLREVQPSGGKNRNAPRQRALLVNRRKDQRRFAGHPPLVMRKLPRDDHHPRIVLRVVGDFPAQDRQAVERRRFFARDGSLRGVRISLDLLDGHGRVDERLDMTVLEGL